jgi:hypothetical protein
MRLVWDNALEYNQFPARKTIMHAKDRAVAIVGVFVAFAALVGCDRIGGRTITVEFRNAEGVRGGEAVYIAGVKVGRVTDEPSLVNGRARVSVLISRKNKHGVPAGTVFLLKADPSEPSKQCLVAYSLGSGPAPPEGSEASYVGVSSRAELLFMMSAEKATKFWEGLTK